MIVCSNCNHQNPDGAVQCEACYTPLPAMTSCPSCQAPVQSDASFCGQCGFDLRTAATSPAQEDLTVPDLRNSAPPSTEEPPAISIPDLLPPEPLVSPEPIGAAVETSPPPLVGSPQGSPMPTSPPPSLGEPAAKTAPPVAPGSTAGATQIQVNQAKLLHVQTSTTIELPPTLTLIHLGKPNERVPPTIDVSGFPNSEIVSRIHANIRVEGDLHYIEDVGSSNGTYINNLPLPPGNRHRLRGGDRVALGKGDKVTFIFQAT